LTVIQTVFGAILLFITTAAEGYRLLWAKFGDDIINLITVAFSNIALVMQAQFSIIGEIFGIFADLIKGNWSGVWEHFVNIANIQGEMVKGIVNNILSIFGTSIDGIVNYFAEMPGRIAAYFSPEALIKIATDAMQAFSDTITAMMPSLPDPSDLMGGLPSLSGAMSSAQNLVSGTAQSVTGAIPSPTSNSFNQSLSFNQPGASADDIARAVRRQTIDLLGQAMS
jgi:phage-related protein